MPLVQHQTEVQHDDMTIPRHHHIRGFQVAVDDVLSVQCQHAPHQLRQRRSQPRLVKSTVGTDVVEERRAVDQVHREEPLAGVRFQRMQPDQVWMIHIRQRSELPLEPEQRCAVHNRQGLEGHMIAVLQVHGLIHDPHAAATQFAQQAVLTEAADCRTFQRGNLWLRRCLRVQCVEERLADQVGKLRQSLDVFLSLWLQTGVTSIPDIDGQQITQQDRLDVFAHPTEIRIEGDERGFAGIPRERFAQANDRRE